MAIADAMAVETRLDTDASEFVGRLTGRVLPAPRTAEDRRLLRLALVDHVLEVAAEADALELRRIAGRYAEVLSRRERILASGGALVGGAVPDEPGRAAASLRAAWMRLARERTPIGAPVPAPRETLAARTAGRLASADGAAQALVAEQVGILELAAFVAVAERPGFAGAVTAILETSGRVRREATHVLEQVREAERALAMIWAIRLEPGSVPRRRETATPGLPEGAPASGDAGGSRRAPGSGGASRP